VGRRCHLTIDDAPRRASRADDPMSVSELRAVFPDVSDSILRETLANHGGDAQRAAEFLLCNPRPSGPNATAPSSSQLTSTFHGSG